MKLTCASECSSSGCRGWRSSSPARWGAVWLLDQLWHRLGIDALLRGLAGRTPRDPVVERVVFALVVNRALARPRSWLRPRGSPTTCICPA
jgi:hypothetical protein